MASNLVPEAPSDTKSNLVPNAPSHVAGWFEAIRSDVLNLHMKFSIYQNMYGSSEAVASLNRFAGAAFSYIQSMMHRDITLSIIRLLDPAGQGNFENLTFERLVEAVYSENVNSQPLQARFGELVKSVEGYREWRNKVMAHNDLSEKPKLYNGTSEFELPSLDKIREILGHMRQVMNLIQEIYGGGHSGYFEPDWPVSGGGKELVERLQELAMRIDKDPRPRWEQLAWIQSHKPAHPQPTPLRSDKNTLLKHQGALREFDDMDEHLEAIRAMRESEE